MKKPLDSAAAAEPRIHRLITRPPTSQYDALCPLTAWLTRRKASYISFSWHSLAKPYRSSAFASMPCGVSHKQVSGCGFEPSHNGDLYLAECTAIRRPFPPGKPVIAPL